MESKLPQDSHMVTDSKDPYEFNFVDSSSSSASHASSHSLTTSWSTNKLLGGSTGSKPKIKQISRTIKPKEPSGSKSPVGAGLTVGIPGKLPNALHTNSSNLKRKRSGSSPSPSSNSGVGGIVTQPVTNVPIAVNNANNPISIAIPTGINLNLTGAALNNINATLTTPVSQQQTLQQQPVIANAKNNIIKDFSIVVTNIDHNVMNGQIISIPSVGLADMTQLQLTNITDSSSKHIINSTGSSHHSSAPAKHGRTKSNSSKHSVGGAGSGGVSAANKSQHSHSQQAHLRTEAAANFANINTLMAAVANNNTIMVDSSGVPSGTLLTTTLPANSHTITLGNSTMSPPQSSPSNTPSPLFTAVS